MKHIKKNVYESIIYSSWPTSELENVEKCPVCKGSGRRVLHDNLRDFTFFCAPGKWTLFECSGCQSAYLDPRPTAESIYIAYKDYYTHSTARSYNDLGVFKKIRRRLSNGYINWRYGTRDNPSSNLGVFFALIFPKMRSILDGGMRGLPRPQNGSSLLDVGCGNGEFLWRAKTMGWSVTGVDIDKKSIETSRKYEMDVRLGGIDMVDAHSERFDVITLSHVVEHVHDPVSMLESCFNLLKVGGYLWIETPNLSSEGHKIFGPYWRGLEPPRHLVLFTLDSLCDILREVGFGKINIQPYRPLAKGMFRESHTIFKAANKLEGCYARDYLKLNCLIRKAERVSRKNAKSREFITIKAWKV